MGYPTARAVEHSDLDDIPLRPVRLCDVPAPVRLKHAQRLVRYEKDPEKIRAILEAALFPSDNIYFVPKEAA